MQLGFNAKAQRCKEAKEEGKNGFQTNYLRLVTQIDKANFIAPWRLGALR